MSVSVHTFRLLAVFCVALVSACGGPAPTAISLPTQPAASSTATILPPAPVSATLEGSSTSEVASVIPAPAPRPVVATDIPTRPSSTADSIDAAYTQQEIDYFLQVALGSEYGDSIEDTIVKWARDVNIEIHGSPTVEDVETATDVISELNELVDGIDIRLDEPTSNLELYFVPEAEFHRYQPSYIPINYGFFWTYWTQAKEIYRAQVFISTTDITQQERSHLIREELTQSLGLMRDSDEYEDSIFYQEWTDVTRYSSLDETVIEILYRPEIHPNMTEDEVTEALGDLGQ